MGPAIEISGGSAANTMVGLASFGGKAAFIGKVADDQFGKVFCARHPRRGRRFRYGAGDRRPPTARSLILVTPDGERTMNTFLGVSPELARSEVDAASSPRRESPIWKATCSTGRRLRRHFRRRRHRREGRAARWH